MHMQLGFVNLDLESSPDNNSWETTIKLCELWKISICIPSCWLIGLPTMFCIYIYTLHI